MRLEESFNILHTMKHNDYDVFDKLEYIELLLRYSDFNKETRAIVFKKIREIWLEVDKLNMSNADNYFKIKGKDIRIKDLEELVNEKTKIIADLECELFFGKVEEVNK